MYVTIHGKEGEKKIVIKIRLTDEKSYVLPAKYMTGLPLVIPDIRDENILSLKNFIPCDTTDENLASWKNLFLVQIP